MAQNIDVYGYSNKDIGRKGVPSANEVLKDAGHEPQGWGEVYDGIGPNEPFVHRGVGEKALEGDGIEQADRVYGGDGTSKTWKGVPSSKAL